MMVLINFSHPLNADAKRILQEKHGVTSFVDIPVHLDLTQPIMPQVRDIVEQALRKVGNVPYLDLAVIPPGYAPAAIGVAFLLPQATFVRLAAQGTSPKWMPVETFVLWDIGL